LGEFCGELFSPAETYGLTAIVKQYF